MSFEKCRDGILKGFFTKLKKPFLAWQRLGRRSVGVASRALSSVFAAHAINRGRNRSQPLSRNFLPALKADPVSAVVQSRQGAIDLR